MYAAWQSSIFLFVDVCCFKTVLRKSVVFRTQLTYSNACAPHLTLAHSLKLCVELLAVVRL